MRQQTTLEQLHPTKTLVLEDRHLNITPKTAAGRINRASNLVRGSVDIGNVNRRHLRAEIKQMVRGDGLSVWTIYAGEHYPVFWSIRAHEVGAHVKIEKGEKPSAQILEA